MNYPIEYWRAIAPKRTAKRYHIHCGGEWEELDEVMLLATLKTYYPVERCNKCAKEIASPDLAYYAGDSLDHALRFEEYTQNLLDFIEANLSTICQEMPTPSLLEMRE